MTSTPMTPAPTRLAGDLNRAQEILAQVTASADAAGPGARSFTRVALAVQSVEAVDKLAAAWGVVPWWTSGRTQYVARWISDGHEAEAEAVYYATVSEATGSGAAA